MAMGPMSLPFLRMWSAPILAAAALALVGSTCWAGVYSDFNKAAAASSISVQPLRVFGRNIDVRILRLRRKL